MEQRYALSAVGAVTILDDLSIAQPIATPLFDTPPDAHAALLSGTSGDELFPLSSIPPLASYPAADVKIFLDFLGHDQGTWGSFTDVTTPVFDLDGDPTTFSTDELTAIGSIWAIMAEDFSPLNVDVTTIEPADMSHGTTAHIVFGGSWEDWLGEAASGTAYRNGFTDTLLPNVGYVFTEDITRATSMAGTGSHEAGHLFGLRHQSRWDSDGELIDEYHRGTGNWAPIMGSVNRFGAELTTWHLGTSNQSAESIQDDLAILTGGTNGFGYRPDDHGNTHATASPLLVGTTVDAQGIIGHMDDVDVFSFNTGTGPIVLTADVLTGRPSLEVVLELYDAAGERLARAEPNQTLETEIRTDVEAGTYYLHVMNNGQYGRLGQYFLSGQVVVGGTLRGAVWNDIDGDGTNDANEPELPGRTVFIDMNNTGTIDPPVQTTFVSTDVPIHAIGIPGSDFAHSEIEVSGLLGTVLDVEVTASIDASESDYLMVQLRSPEGKHVSLFNDPGTLGGSWTFTDTHFADDAPLSIYDGDPPFTGTFQPHHELSQLVGSTANGTWTLRVAGEAELTDWSLTLTTTVDRVATTDQFGFYEFADLPPGDYVVRQLQQPGWTRTFPQNDHHLVTIHPFLTTQAHFGNTQTGGIQGRVFHDRDGNRLHDPGEEGFAGWTVWLDQNGDGVLTETPRNLEPDDYFSGTPLNNIIPQASVRMIGDEASIGGPEVTAEVYQWASTGNKIFGNFHRGNTWTHSTRMLEVEFHVPVIQMSIDVIGAVGTSRAELEVYDADDNLIDRIVSQAVDVDRSTTVLAKRALPESARVVVRGFDAASTVYLDNLQFTETEPFVRSGADGYYAFENLLPDTYRVAVASQGDWVETSTNPLLGYHSVTFAGGFGTVVDGVDFAHIRHNSIAGRVFHDLDGNGAWDPDEPTLAGQTVYLDMRRNGEADTGVGVFVGSAGLPRAIPDGASTTVSRNINEFLGDIPLNGSNRLIDIQVSLDITHPNASDLEAVLVSPAGTRVTLFAGLTGSGANFSGTTLSDQAELSITEAAAPYSGSYRPTGSLADFRREYVGGTWELELTDTAADGNAGTLHAWSLEITYGDPRWTTDEEGRYTIEGLPPRGFQPDFLVPGRYRVGFLPEPGWEQTAPRTGAAYWIDVPSDQQVPGRNFGVTHLAEVHGVVWDDKNHNGLQDADEPGLAGVTVFADANHNGVFDDETTFQFASTDLPHPLPPDSTISSSLHVSGLERPIADVTLTFAMDFQSNAAISIALVSPSGLRVVLEQGANATTAGFVDTTFDSAADARMPLDGSPPYTGSFRPLEPLADYRGEDPNGIWTLEIVDPDVHAGEGGLLTDWSLAITTAAEHQAVSDEDGNYTLMLPPGKHILRQTHEAGWHRTWPPQPGHEGHLDGSPGPSPPPDVAGGHELTVSSGQLVEVLDFGRTEIVDVPPAGIRGFVWEDLNGDGLLDPGEPPLAGRTVFLDLNRTGQLDPGDPTAVTDLDGSYLFDDLPPGEYVVTEILPDGWLRSHPAHRDAGFRLLATTGTGGVNDFSLVELETDPPAELLIGSAGFNPSITFGPDGILYAGGSSFLRTLDPDTGASTNVASFQEADGTSHTVRGLAFHPDGTMFGLIGTITRTLVTVDPATAQIELIGELPQTVWGLQFADDGTLYGAFASLYEIDLATGNVIETIGSLPATVNDLTMGPDGLLYGVRQSSSELFRIDPADASTQLLGTYDSRVWGVAAQNMTGSHSITVGDGELIEDVNFGSFLDVSPPLPGDYNGNGAVDAADYTVWRDTLGQVGLVPYSGADGDGDGDVTPADYDIWRADFGNTVVPIEPAGDGAGLVTVPESEQAMSIGIGGDPSTWAGRLAVLESRQTLNENRALVRTMATAATIDDNLLLVLSRSVADMALLKYADEPIDERSYWERLGDTAREEAFAAISNDLSAIGA